MSSTTTTTPETTPETPDAPSVPKRVRSGLVSAVRQAFQGYLSAKAAVERAQDKLVRDEVSLGIVIARAQGTVGDSGIIGVCRDAGIPETIPDVTLYRWRSAGLVSLALTEAGLDHPGMASSALAYLARFVDTPKDLARVYKRAVKDAGGTPGYGDVKSAVSALFPDGDAPQAGGSQAGSGTARNASTGPADAPKQTAKDKAASAPSHEVQLTPDKAATEAAVGTIGRILRTAAKDLPETAYPVLRAAVYATVQACKDHEVQNMLAAVSQLRDAKDAPQAAADAPQAETTDKPKRTRRTRKSPAAA